MFGPMPTGWSVAIAAQKVQNRRSLSAWKTERSEMNFMPQVSARKRGVGIGGGLDCARRRARRALGNRRRRGAGRGRGNSRRSRERATSARVSRRAKTQAPASGRGLRQIKPRGASQVYAVGMRTEGHAVQVQDREHAALEELTLRIARRANRLAQQREVPPGGELALWLEAEAEVKRELRASGRKSAPRVVALQEGNTPEPVR